MRNGISILTQGRPRHIAGGEPRSTETDWSQAIGDENQLIRAETDTVATPAGSRWKVEFVYDGKMRMRKQLSSTWSGATWGIATEVRFLYDGMLIVQERTGANAVVASYLRGLDLSGSYSGAGGIGGLLMRSAWNGTAYVHSYYHADGIGNITSLRKSDGTETASYRCEPFGRMVSTAPGAGTLGDVNKMRFSSKYLDGNTGFYYYGYRFYDPGTQKWLNRDCIFENGGVNVYEFVQNVPTVRVDALGLIPTLPPNFGTPNPNPPNPLPGFDPKATCINGGGSWVSIATCFYGGSMSTCMKASISGIPGFVGGILGAAGFVIAFAGCRAPAIVAGLGGIAAAAGGSISGSSAHCNKNVCCGGANGVGSEPWY